MELSRVKNTKIEKTNLVNGLLTISGLCKTLSCDGEQVMKTLAHFFGLKFIRFIRQD